MASIGHSFKYQVALRLCPKEHDVINRNVGNPVLGEHPPFIAEHIRLSDVVVGSVYKNHIFIQYAVSNWFTVIYNSKIAFSVIFAP